MRNPMAFGIMLCVVVMAVSQIAFAQKSSTSGRWRLKFEPLDTPRPITVTDPDGQKNMYWYFRYQVTNDMERDIPWMVNIKIVVDKTREGVAESKVPGLFYRAEIPDDITTDKESYLLQLRTYYDVDFPIAKKAIWEQLQLHPKLMDREKTVLGVLDMEKTKTLEEVMKESNLSYAEAESALLSLVMSNLAISQETQGAATFMGGTTQNGMFLENDQETVKKVGDKVGDWEIVTLSPSQAVLKKGEVIATFGKGSTLDYLYLKSHKTIAERDLNYVSGMSGRGVYKGQITGDTTADKRFLFQNTVIAKKSTRYGIAIFEDISQEMDFMAIVVAGLVDPIVRRQGRIYLENESVVIGYVRETMEEQNQATLTQLYQRWVILSSKETKRK